MSVIFHLEVSRGKLHDGVNDLICRTISLKEYRACGEQDKLMLKYSKSLNSVHKKNIYSLSKVSLQVTVQ